MPAQAGIQYSPTARWGRSHPLPTPEFTGSPAFAGDDTQAGAGDSRPLIQRLDAQLARHGVEAVAQRLGHRNAVLAAILPFQVALLAGKPDALYPRQSLGATHRAHRAVDLPLELRRRHERLDRHRDEKM